MRLLDALLAAAWSAALFALALLLAFAALEKLEGWAQGAPLPPPRPPIVRPGPDVTGTWSVQWGGNIGSPGLRYLTAFHPGGAYIAGRFEEGWPTERFFGRWSMRGDLLTFGERHLRWNHDGSWSWCDYETTYRFRLRREGGRLVGESAGGVRIELRRLP
jgi:hypothetical protein